MVVLAELRVNTLLCRVGSYCKILPLSYLQIVYKKGHDERKSKYTSLPDPPDVEQAKKVTRQLSDVSRMQNSFVEISLLELERQKGT